MTASTPPQRAPERITGAHAIVRTLEDLGTELVFGIPGGAVLPLYDALFESTKLRHVLTRHEQGPATLPKVMPRHPERWAS